MGVPWVWRSCLVTLDLDFPSGTSPGYLPLTPSHGPGGPPVSGSRDSSKARNMFRQSFSDTWSHLKGSGLSGRVSMSLPRRNPDPEVAVSNRPVTGVGEGAPRTG